MNNILKRLVVPSLMVGMLPFTALCSTSDHTIDALLKKGCRSPQVTIEQGTVLNRFQVQGVELHRSPDSSQYTLAGLEIPLSSNDMNRTIGRITQDTQPANLAKFDAGGYTDGKMILSFGKNGRVRTESGGIFAGLGDNFIWFDVDMTKVKVTCQ